VGTAPIEALICLAVVIPILIIVALCMWNKRRRGIWVPRQVQRTGGVPCHTGDGGNSRQHTQTVIEEDDELPKYIDSTGIELPKYAETHHDGERTLELGSPALRTLRHGISRPEMAVTRPESNASLPNEDV